MCVLGVGQAMHMQNVFWIFSHIFWPWRFPLSSLGLMHCPDGLISNQTLTPSIATCYMFLFLRISLPSLAKNI